MQPWFGAASRVRQRVEFDVADYDLTFKSQFGTSDGNTHRAHARVQTDVAANAAFGFSGGLEWLGERGGSTFITAGAAGAVPVERGVLGLFGEGRWHAGDRATHHRRRSRRAHHARCVARRSARLYAAPGLSRGNDLVGESEDRRLVPGWRQSVEGRWTRLRGSFGTGIRPPDAFEIAFTDNSGLKPERSKSGEFGLTQALAGGAVQIDGTAFFNAYRDLIISVGRTFAGSSRYRTDNISNARARGAELSAAWRINAGIDLRGNYTFLDSEILAVNGSSDGANAVRGRRCTAAAAASLGIDRRIVDARAALARSRSSRCAAPRSMPSRRSAPTGGLFTNPGHTVDQPRRIVAAGQGGRSVRARPEPVRPRLRGSAGLPGPGPDGLRGCAICCGPITSRSGMRPARRWWWTGSPSASLMVRSPAFSVRTVRARPRYCAC